MPLSHPAGNSDKVIALSLILIGKEEKKKRRKEEKKKKKEKKEEGKKNAQKIINFFNHFLI